MHQSHPVDQLAARMDSDEACLQCHSHDRANIAAHTHHAADSEGSRCYNCHMPHTVYGLLKAIRSHHIDSPSVQTQLDTGRPNACSLCHLDQPLSFVARALHERHGQPMPDLSDEQQTIADSVLMLLRGDANQRALIAWHMGWEPAKVASGRDWLAPYLAHLLRDPYPAVRYIAHRSLKRLPHFEDFGFDFVGSPESHQAAHRRAINTWYQRQPPAGRLDRTGTAVLINHDGRMLGSQLAELAAQRDDRPVDLRE
jgi:hypothetical protein